MLFLKLKINKNYKKIFFNHKNKQILYLYNLIQFSQILFLKYLSKIYFIFISKHFLK